MISNVYAPGFDWLGSFFSSGGWTGWSANLLIVGLLTLFGVTVLYMLGMAFNVAPLKMWAKGEYMQVVVTFLLAFALVNATAIIWTVMINSVTFIYTSTGQQGGAQLNNGQSYDPFAFTQAYIQSSYINCEKHVYQILYPINLYYKFVGRIFADSLGADELGGWSTSVYTGLIEYVTGNINNLLLLHYIQIRFLSLIKYVMPLLIEVGLVLRAFPATRGTGGFLLAVGFGFFTVYPISLALLTTFQPPPGGTFCTSFQPPPLLSLDNGFCGTDAGEVLQIKYSLLASQKETSGLLDQIKNFLPSFYLQAVFFPLVALTVTLSFIREFAELLSGDLNEIGRGLIKLI